MVVLCFINKFMSILNEKCFPVLFTWDWDDYSTGSSKCYMEIHDSALIFYTEQWEDKDYYYISFLHKDAFREFDLTKIMGCDSYNRLKANDLTLILQNNHESYHSVVDGIYQYIILKHGINPKNIILISQSRDIDREIEVISKKYYKEKIQGNWLRIFEHDASILAKKEEINIPPTLQEKEYARKFLSFNGMWRPHRSSLIAGLICEDILDEGFVSYNTVPEISVDGQENFDFLLDYHKHNKDFLQKLVYNAKSIKETNKLFLDTANNQKQNIDLAKISNSPLEYYIMTYLSVVTETNYSKKTSDFHDSFAGQTGPGRLLSEKTFKPITLKHPFIIAGVPGTLQLLREIGYKTFHPVINESYDLETDNSKRIEMIIHEIKRLCYMSPEELKYYLHACREICEYNFNVLKSKTSFMDKLC